MSNTQYAFLPRSGVPTRRALQASIDALGFPLKLYPKLDFLKDSGFSPCVLDGEKGAGFEVGFGTSAEVLSDDVNLPKFRKAVGSRDACISMTWHSGMEDCAAALIVGCALAKDFDAVVTYEGNAPEGFARLRKVARLSLDMWRKERARGRTRVTDEVCEHFDAHLRDRAGWSLGHATVRLSPDGTKARWIASYGRASKISCRLAVYENTEGVTGAIAVYDLFPEEDEVAVTVDNHGHVTAFENDKAGVEWTWFPIRGAPVLGRVFDKVSSNTSYDCSKVDSRKTLTSLSLHVLRQVPRHARNGCWTLETSLHKIYGWGLFNFTYSDFITWLPAFRTREEREAYLLHLRQVRDSIRKVRRRWQFRDAAEYVELFVSEAEKVLSRPWRRGQGRPRLLPRVRSYQRQLDRAWKAHVRAMERKDRAWSRST